MFEPIGGSVYIIPDNAFGFNFVCNLPPQGFGVNSNTGKLEETDILKRSDIPEEQYWERFTLPLDWKKKRTAEKERQNFDRFYVDPYCETIRRREWKRRLCGVWFWNYNPYTKESELKYITGTHYFYITVWKFQGKFMDFRINDLECWYVIKYCETDPECLGLNEITKRKLGKTARLGCWIYERTSRMRNHHAGFQSKSDDDADEVMQKAIVQPWQKLPDYFRPIYDLMKGDAPTEMRFFHTSRRGQTAEQDRDGEEEALESWIDYGASGESVYDGPELGTYGADEAGKTKKPVSIKERQSVVRYCAEIDGQFQFRKQWYTTTVEVEKNEEENIEFQELTASSNPMERDDNGRTTSGLYTYFLPAYKGMFFDPKYGYPDEERALKFIDNTHRSLKAQGKLRELSSFKRKNPKTFKEAFSADGEFALYNPELLNEQLDKIQWTNEWTEFGDLDWEDGYRFKRPVKNAQGEEEWIPNKLKWVPNPHGVYEKIKEWFPKEPNNVYKTHNSFAPNNNYWGRIGCDPFKYDKTKDKRRSNCAAFYYQVPDPVLPSIFDDTLTMRYALRRESTGQANEDVLKMAWWCGCEVLFERNVNHWKKDFNTWECDAFLMWLPGEVEPGLATTNDVIQVICNYTESYINKHIGNVYFKTLIRKDTGWLGFKVEDTEKFDEPMGVGVTLIAVKGRSYRHPQEKGIDISNYFRMHKVG